MKIMILYRGGCGGETFSWFLDSILNRNFQTNKSLTNARSHNDIFNKLFHYQTMPRNLFPLRKDRDWSDVPVDILREWIDKTAKKTKKTYLIGKAHPHVLPKDQWSKVFPDWHIINILPIPSRFWVSQTILYHKTAFFKDDVKLNRRYATHPQYNEANDFYHKHGWIPGYWKWILSNNNRSIHDLEDFFTITNKGSMRENIQSNQIPCAFHIDGPTLIIDQSLSNFYKAIDFFNLSQNLNLPKIVPEINSWIDKNRSIFKKYNILDKVENGYEMDEDETHTFLCNLFYDKAVKLTNGDVS